MEYSVQTFQPTFEEFRDFEGYVKSLEAKFANKAGICKVIPPPEFKEIMKSTSSYNPSVMDKVIIPKTLRQTATAVKGKSRIYKIIGWKDVPEMTVKEFIEKTGKPQLKTPRHFDDETLEKMYWEKLSNGESFYGAGVQLSFMNECNSLWNLNSLKSLLDRNKRKIDGIHSPYMYFGSWKTTFCWHTEDMELYSINYLHFGAPKTWYGIPPTHARRFETVAGEFFPLEHQDCQQFLRHKFTMIKPSILESYGITVNKITQRAGDFIITFPDGYHAGFNHGFNCAEAVNFATESWPPFGRKSKPCKCEEFASVKMNMKIFTPPKPKILKQSASVKQPRSSRRQKLEMNSNEEQENIYKPRASIRPRAQTVAPYQLRPRQNTTLY